MTYENEQVESVQNAATDSAIQPLTAEDASQVRGGLSFLGYAVAGIIHAVADHMLEERRSGAVEAGYKRLQRQLGL